MASPSTGLYVDIENLQEDAKSLVGALLDSWPRSFPRPGLVTLYVPADQAELWRMWGITRFKEATIRVRGIQRFAGHLSKNSADLAIATDAVSDFVRDRVGHVAVFSDDSDFMSLYVKIREESGEGKTGETPFLWVLTDRRGTKSLNIRRYFPSEHIFVVKSVGYQGGGNQGGGQQSGPPQRSGERSGGYGSSQRSNSGSSAAPLRSRSEPRARRPVAPPADPVADRAIAKAIVTKMPLGYFKSTDCQSLVRDMYPNHPLAHASSGVVGQRFVKNILPLLLDLGVTEPNPNRRPRRFQITEEAKQKVNPRSGGNGPNSSPPSSPPSSASTPYGSRGSSSNYDSSSSSYDSGRGSNYGNSSSYDSSSSSYDSGRGSSSSDDSSSSSYDSGRGSSSSDDSSSSSYDSGRGSNYGSR